MAKLFLTSIDLNKNEMLNMVLQVLASAPSSPVEGQMYYNSTDETAYIRTGSATWLDLGIQGGAGATNLTFSRDGTTVTVESDTGTDAVLPAATAALAGVMVAADKSKLDGIEALADVTDNANVDAAGATMDADTNVSGNGWVLDEDTMVSDDNTKVPTQQSVKAYVDSSVSGALVYQGGYNAATNTPDLDTAPSGINQGFTYTVTAAGTFFTEDVQIGDMLIAEINNPTTLADWTVVNKNIPDIVSASETEEGIIELATQAETDTGTDDARAVTPLKLATTLGVTGTLNAALRFTQQIGNGAATSIVVTHNIGRQFLTAQVFETSSPFAQVECDIEMDTTNATSFTFNTAPASNEYTVVITG